MFGYGLTSSTGKFTNNFNRTSGRTGRHSSKSYTPTVPQQRMASDYLEHLKTLNTFFPPVYDEGALPCLNHPIGRTTINMKLDI